MPRDGRVGSLAAASAALALMWRQSVSATRKASAFVTTTSALWERKHTARPDWKLGIHRPSLSFPSNPGSSSASWALAAASVGASFAVAKRGFSQTSRTSQHAETSRPGGPTEADKSYTILEHGYALHSGPEGTGGWLQHRSEVDKPGSGPGHDWVHEVFADPGNAVGANLLEASAFAQSPTFQMKHKPHILVLYGSLRETSFSRQLALECARLLEVLGADVRVFCPAGLPVRDPALEGHPKVKELRALSLWSEGHVWVSPEMHGCVTGAFKNQIDWLPLNTGSVRPTQGRTCAILQVNGGSQSFNVVNELRRLARWMRMPCCTNQSSVAKAWQEFEGGRMKPSSYRERVVDVMEEFFKFTLVMREHADFFVDRYSERKEVAEKGRLLTQAEKEARKLKDEAAAEAAAGKK
eukprot:TRINITY_DN92743_c0_g1_i1.p1 TRINITY_DN92743_c0_g1~~TRINITY_DN92743_c0_g1_i1.p1  ORF type:complete len:428 (+),score=60.61 TRINITY_DN92743_c0_g1_i1:52-1284(+)